MLRIHEVTSASNAKNYYAAADYYSQGQETVGQWGGKLAARIGLAGTVDKAGFDLLCDNRRPDGKPLTARTNDNRRVGYDFTFSGPKSFSVLEAFAGDDERRRLLAAFDASVDATMGEAEADMQTRIRLLGQDADRTTGNMAWAGFDHSTSRPVPGSPPDPHRHKHVLVFNATLDPVEGRIKAGQFGGLKRDGEYYTAVFYSHLADRLDAMGYRIDRRGGKAWEIAGVPQAVIDKFSKRTDEIEDAAERQGIMDARRKAELGAKTRSKKQKELTPAELRNAWDAQLTDGERDALAAVYRKGSSSGNAVTPGLAMDYALAHCSEQLSVMPERELKRVALLHGLGDVRPEHIAAEMLAGRHGLIAREIDGRRMVTTERLQREENELVGFVAGGLGSACPVGVAKGLSRKTADGRILNDGQFAAVTGLLNSSNRVGLVEGPAGAGKSSMLGKFDEGMRLAGQSVTYLATTAAAAGVLQYDGFDAHTLARFLLDDKMQKAARGGHVVVDESSMLGHGDALKLVRLAQKDNLKLVFVGDPMQHGSVPRGAFMRLLTEYGTIKPFRLTEIMRQESPDYRAAAQLLSEGKTLDGFDALDNMGWVKEHGDDAGRCRLIADEYLQAVKGGKSILVVSPTHAEAARITDSIRSGLRGAGRLGQTDHAFTRLVQVNASVAERGQATTYRPGDVIQFHQNAKGGFKKGERLILGSTADVPLGEAAKFSLYRPGAIGLAEGDAIRFTGTVKTLGGEHTLKNGMARTVAGFTAKGIRLDNGWIVAADAGHFRHGFVETSFGSQGRTVQRAILAMSSASLPATNQEQIYVSASRAKERMTLYTDDKAAVRLAVQRSSRKLLALDLKPNPKPQRRERLQIHLDRLRRLSVLDRTRAALATWPGLESPGRSATHVERIRASLPEKEQGYGR